MAVEPEPGAADQGHRHARAQASPSPRPARTIYDLGQNFAGWDRLRVTGPAGTTVTMRHGEVLNADGTLYTANLRSAQLTDTFTLKGGGAETFEPRFTFHGYRYVELTGRARRRHASRAASSPPTCPSSARSRSATRW